MSTYENLHGRRINVLSSNPSNPKEGEVWYNSTLGLLKGYVLGNAVWTSGGNLNTKRSATISGTVNAGLASFGYIYPPSSPVGGSYATEEYNGTAWTSVNNGNTQRYQTSSVGTQTAAVAYGGLNGTTEPGPYTMSSSFEGYNGTTWTNLTSAPLTRAGDPPMVGTSTALAQVCGNSNASGEPSNTTQEYNGSWSTGENYPISVQGLSGAGIQTASVHMAGATNAPGSSMVTTANEYDGTDFSATGSLTDASRNFGGRTGTQTAAVFAGGISPFNQKTLDYDGSTFSLNPATQVTTRPSIGQGKMSGTAATAALVCGSGGTPTLTNTEEFAGAVVETKTLTTG